MIRYFGPALSGKTTTIKLLFSRFGKSDRVLRFESSSHKSLFLDYDTITFQSQQFRLKIRLSSMVRLDISLNTISSIALQTITTDGIIFVADSQQSAYDRNLTIWNEISNFFEQKFIKMPKILAFNKQDLLDKFDISEFLEDINHLKFKNLKIKKTIAIEGVGVVESFKDLIDLIFKNDSAND
jgi:GTPase SAR1 family protein